MSRKYFFLLSLLLFIKACFMVFVVMHAGIELGPDEAQYWTWSQALDWGYYSKPPGIAWLISVGTQLFGNTELGVRSVAIGIGTLLPFALYFLALRCGTQQRTAFWAAVMMALTPLGFASSLFTTTDAGMVLFWTLAATVVASALKTDDPPRYLILGIVIGLGALFKWPIYFFWVVVVVAIIFVPPLRSKRLFGGVAISLLGLLPSVIWNASHNWGTFRHVFSTVRGGDVNFATARGNFWDFIGAQVGLLSPIIFVLLLIALVYLLRNFKTIPRQFRFCAFLCFGIIGMIAFAAAFKKMQGNWGVFAYPTGIVFLAWVVLERLSMSVRWLQAGLLLSLLLIIGLVGIPTLQKRGFAIPNVLKHTIGWSPLSKVLEKEGYDPVKDFLFGDKYQVSSILSFYGPQQKRAYFLNLHRIRNNQFSYWPDMADEQLGKTGYFVVVENAPHLYDPQKQQIEEYQKLLSLYFKKVTYLGVKPLYEIGGEVVKGALIFKCEGYNGERPAESLLY